MNICLCIFPTQSVYDPTTGERVPVSEAINRGIIDEVTGKYFHKPTGETLNLSDAIDKGRAKSGKSDVHLKN